MGLIRTVTSFDTITIQFILLEDASRTPYNGKCVYVCVQNLQCTQPEMKRKTKDNQMNQRDMSEFKVWQNVKSNQILNMDVHHRRR